MPIYNPSSEEAVKITVTDDAQPNLVENIGSKGAVTSSLIKTADNLSQSAEERMDLTPNDATFYEIVRRIPEYKRQIIETRLKEVNFSHLDSLHYAMANQENLLEDVSFIHDEIFPFAALQAVRMGEISVFQFGTLMSLWGSLETILPRFTGKKDQAKPKFVPLFIVGLLREELANDLLISCLQKSQTFPNLVIKTAYQLLRGIYNKAIHLPKSEQGFWVVENNTHKSEMSQTITQRIKALDVNFLAFDLGVKFEMIPSFGLQQIFLDVAFPHAVRINPVIGDSTPIDIRKGSLERYRDIALPFPGNELPKVADSFPAPSALDFIFHDRYHAIRASRVNPQETAHYVSIGDHFYVMQKLYDSAVKLFSKRHDEHMRLLPEFGKALENLPADKKLEVTEQVLKKFNREIAIINNLKKLRKLNCQLKFRIWDMERHFSGSVIDVQKETPIQELRMIIGNIQMDLEFVWQQFNTVWLKKYSGRRAALAVLEAVKPDAATLTTIQSRIRHGGDMFRQSFFPAESQSQIAFEDAILEAPVLT